MAWSAPGHVKDYSFNQSIPWSTQAPYHAPEPQQPEEASVDGPKFDPEVEMQNMIRQVMQEDELLPDYAFFKCLGGPEELNAMKDQTQRLNVPIKYYEKSRMKRQDDKLIKLLNEKSTVKQMSSMYKQRAHYHKDGTNKNPLIKVVIKSTQEKGVNCNETHEEFKNLALSDPVKQEPKEPTQPSVVVDLDNLEALGVDFEDPQDAEVIFDGLDVSEEVWAIIRASMAANCIKTEPKLEPTNE